MSRALVLGIVATAAASVGTAMRADPMRVNQNAGPTVTRPSPPATRSATATADAAFVAKAADAAAGLQELARLGAARGSDAAVKVLAKRLIEEQAAIAEGLTTLARARRVELPPPPASVREEAAALARHSGAAFDRAFVAAIVSSHDAAVALFEAEAADGRDDEVKEWAAKQLPALRARQAKARALGSSGGA
jgi:putative membrane protein